MLKFSSCLLMAANIAAAFSVGLSTPVIAGESHRHSSFSWQSFRNNRSATVVSGVLGSTAVGAERGLAIAGKIMMVRDNTSTEVFVHATGLGTVETTYEVHVHDKPCSLGGGAHYKIDPTIAETLQDNEIWPVLAVDETGSGAGFDSVDHIARMSAQSIVVHDADGARIACGDFKQPLAGRNATGGFDLFDTVVPDPNYPLDDFAGSAQMVRTVDHTMVQVAVSGLVPNTTYPAHVHALRCEHNQGGGHYEIDPSVEGVIEENEIWPSFTTDETGAGASVIQSSHVARGDAQSIVIHAPTGEKMACANLDLPTLGSGRFVTHGELITTPTALSRGYDITGSARLVRSSRGHTIVSMRAEGLDPQKGVYPAHVHNRRCAEGGGAHYKIDESIDEVIEENEIWPSLRVFSNGLARGFSSASNHIARPDAQSIVVHDPEDGARLVCVDLVEPL